MGIAKKLVQHMRPLHQPVRVHLVGETHGAMGLYIKLRGLQRLHSRQQFGAEDMKRRIAGALKSRLLASSVASP